MTKPDTGGRGEGRSSDLVMVEREVLADALAFLESEMHWSQPAPDMGEEPSDQFTYDAIPVAMALRSALQSVEGGVQGSIATKQESCPESAPRTETAGEALPFGIIDPKYAAFYTVARLTAWSYGYAIAMHGSFTRDLDLIAIPWTDAAVSPEKLIHQIQYRTGCTPVKPNASIREHGRIVWTLSFPEFDCPRFVDFSIIPPSALLSKTLTKGEQRSIATKQSTDPEGNSRTETAGGAV